MKKIFLVGYYGYFNLGDEAILLATILNLEKISKDKLIFYIPSISNFEEYKKIIKSKIIPIKRFDFFKIIKKIKESDLVIIGGGGIYQDTTSFKSFLYYSLILYISQIINKKNIIIGQSFSPLKRQISKKILTHILNKTNYIAVRDTFSKQYLKNQLKIKKDIKIFPDLVFSLHDFFLNSNNSNLNINFNKLFSNSQKNIAFIIRNHKLIYDNLDTLINIIKKKQDFNFIIFSFQYSLDKDILKIIKCKNCNLILKKVNLLDAVNIIKEVDGVISVRLHGSIFSFILNKPFIALSYDKKIDNFMNDIKNKNIVNLKNLDKEGFLYLLNNFLNIKESKNINLDIYKGNLQILYKEIVELW